MTTIAFDPLAVLSPAGTVFRTVFTWEPWALYGVALLGLIVGVALVLCTRRSLQRARREAAASPEGDGVRTGQRADLKRFGRIERLRYAGIAVAAVALAAGFFGLQLRDQADVNLRNNIELRYGSVVEAVDEVEHIDGGYLVEMHWAKPDSQVKVGGARESIVDEDVLVTLDDDSRPTLDRIPDEVLKEYPELRT